MSFKVNWNTLETDSLRSWTTELLTNALNSGKRPHILASDIVIKDLNFGKVAPDFEILEIGDLDRDRFRGIFKITYSGDFHLTLHTKVQANPLKIHLDNLLEKEISLASPFVTPNFLLSLDAFNIPLDLRLSDIKISGIGIIVFSKTKGLTLVFRNDPLDSIKVSSTFDSVQVLANFLQNQIENQIRDLFRETLPTLIHKLSLKYVSSHELFSNLRDHLTSTTVASNQDFFETECVALQNLAKLSGLCKLRETLRLRIPGLKRIMQRNNIEKFNQKMYPNLSTSLYSNLNLSDAPFARNLGNCIPPELLVTSDSRKKDEILKEVASIQKKSFASANTDPRPPRRRVIKFKRKSKVPTTEPISQPEGCSKSTAMEPSATIYLDAVTDSSTTVTDDNREIEQPKPMRPTLTSLQSSRIDPKSPLSPSPLNTNHSFLGNVGLGFSYYNITNPPTIPGSPIRKEAIYEKKLNVKKSMNRIDVTQINEKSHEKSHEKIREKMHEKSHEKSLSKSGSKKLDSPNLSLALSTKLAQINHPAYELPPPPYYQV